MAGDRSAGVAHCALLTTEFAGQEPGKNESGDIVVLTDGPVYNAAELKKSLEASGGRLRTGKQAEIIAHLFARDGERAFAQIDGDCAIVVVDLRNKRVYLVRDAIGTKPLYYHVDKDRCIFASEIKGILALEGFDKRLDRDGMLRFLTFGCLPAPYTLFTGVKKPPNACFARLAAGEENIEEWWNPLAKPVVEGKNLEHFSGALNEVLHRACAKRGVGDKKLAVFMGGVDSCAVAAYLVKDVASAEVHTFTIDMKVLDSNAPDVDELADLMCSREMAKAMPIRQHEGMPGVTELFGNIFEEVNSMNDDPYNQRNTMSASAARMAHGEGIRVGLIGEPADTLFGTGVKYLLARALSGKWSKMAWMPRFLRKALLSPLTALKFRDNIEILPNYQRELWRNFATGRELYWGSSLFYLPVVHRELLSRDFFGAVRNPDVYDAVEALYSRARKARPGAHPFDLMSYKDIDGLCEQEVLNWERCCAGNSIELRAPFGDRELMELAYSIPYEIKCGTEEKKIILKKAVEGMLPHDAIYRKKVASGQAMIGWVRQRIGKTLLEVYSKSSPEARGLFNEAYLKQLIEWHEAKRADLTQHLVVLLVFLLWHRRWLEDNPFSLDDVKTVL
jgi:asparagine synthase (glutamine-hydrolysing)